ncbi:MAG: DUF1446 domain-containing protein [Flavobacteriaceae bacterium]|nr:DUF1446 domain-containing protein [Flavobacteriaceae bacterium]NVJ71651.1 DUF1446 domain-containing protein [Flavobacteriaceae bacterium]
MSKRSIRIGSGAGYSGDLIQPAVQLAEEGTIDYLIFECLAERTIALAQLQKLKDPQLGYDPLLEERIKAVLPICVKKNIKIISNMGAANPIAAVDKIIELAKQLKIKKLKVVAISGDDVINAINDQDYKLIESGDSISVLKNQLVSANAYLGLRPIVEALKLDADIIITGRVADPAIFMAPLFYEFNWDIDNSDLLGKATAMGHLLECAAQVCGGYFNDLDKKQVPNPEAIGFPIAKVTSDGHYTITKVPNSGGIINKATCTEQLLYEIHDPKNYITPDVIADFSSVRFRELASNQVEISGATGANKTGKLKVSLGYKDGYIGEGQMSYGGYQAKERASLALKIIKSKLHHLGLSKYDANYDLIGVNSLSKDQVEESPNEIRIRVALRTKTKEEAITVGQQVEALYTNGPAAGGGASKSVKEIIAVQSILIDENLPTIQLTTKTIES